MKTMFMSMRKICRAKFSVTVWSVVVVSILAALITLIVKPAQRSHHHVHPSVPDNYTTALHQALLFFNAQRSGNLPKYNNISWRGDSCLSDGGSNTKNLVVNIMTVETRASQLPCIFCHDHVELERDRIRCKICGTGRTRTCEGHQWGTEYLLKTFNSSAADSVGYVVADVRGADDTDSAGGGDHEKTYTYWIRP